MAPLDHVDGVDLQIAQMLYGAKGRVSPVAKRRPLIEALGAKPDAPRLHFVERDGVARCLGHGVSLSRQRHETTTSFLGAGRPARWNRLGTNEKARWSRADALIQRA